MSHPARSRSVREEVIAPYCEVRGATGTGAGVHIRWKGETLVLTAAHVVEDDRAHETRPRLIFRGQGEDRSIEAEIVAYTRTVNAGGYDLALLKPAKKLDGRPAKLLLELELEVGEDAFMIGTPAGQYGQLDRCLISTTDFPVTGFKRTVTVVSGAGWYGNSGGPIYVEREGHWVLAGITTHLAQRENPRSPSLCQTPASIAKLLREDYKPGEPIPPDGVGDGWFIRIERWFANGPK